MEPMDRHYYRLKDFFKAKQKAKVFMDFTPETSGKFFLGADVACDVLFKGRMTKFLEKATHIYDGSEFIENTSKTWLASDYLKDFTIKWTYIRRYGVNLNKDIVIIGSKSAFPKISITKNGLIKIDLVEASSGRIDSYIFRYPEPAPDEISAWLYDNIAIEKNGDELCLVFNGVPQGILKVRATYKDCDKDGIGLLGDYYRGAGENVFSTMLYMCAIPL